MYNLFELDNKLKIIAEDINYVNSVCIGLWIKNGSRNENKKNNGISHFIEHMLFKGTTNKNSMQIASVIEDVGGQLNAFTGKESTCYYIKVLNSHLDLSLELLSDMLFNSLFDDKEIEKEKSVIDEEINMTEDDPEDILIDLHNKAVWGNDPIALPILGSSANVNSFTRQDIMNFIKENYIPSNSVISISGNFSQSEIAKKIEKYFGHWNDSVTTKPKYTTPLIQNNHLYKNKPIEQLHMSLGIEGLPLGDPNLYSLLVLSNLIGGGASSILFQKLREDMGLCYSIYTYVSSYKNTGLLSIYSGLSPAYGETSISAIKEELDKFVKLDLRKSDIDKSKEQLKGSYILSHENTSSRMFGNGKSILLLNEYYSPVDIMKKIDKIDQDSLKYVIDKTLKQGIVNSAFIGNIENPESLIKVVQN
ncbi:MAG: M16 family metallopeptidase [Clostridiaceae bacterium]